MKKLLFKFNQNLFTYVFQFICINCYSIAYRSYIIAQHYVTSERITYAILQRYKWLHSLAFSCNSGSYFCVCYKSQKCNCIL